MPRPGTGRSAVRRPPGRQGALRSRERQTLCRGPRPDRLAAGGRVHTRLPHGREHSVVFTTSSRGTWPIPEPAPRASPAPGAARSPARSPPANRRCKCAATCSPVDLDDQGRFTRISLVSARSEGAVRILGLRGERRHHRSAAGGGRRGGQPVVPQQSPPPLTPANGGYTYAVDNPITNSDQSRAGRGQGPPLLPQKRRNLHRADFCPLSTKPVRLNLVSQRTERAMALATAGGERGYALRPPLGSVPGYTRLRRLRSVTGRGPLMNGSRQLFVLRRERSPVVVRPFGFSVFGVPGPGQ
jgi:hypothetical protein